MPMLDGYARAGAQGRIDLGPQARLWANHDSDPTGTVAALDLINLPRLMRLSAGAEDVVIGLVDGAVSPDDPFLRDATLRRLTTGSSEACNPEADAACRHGTAVARILCGGRDATPPGICPACPLLVRPIFVDARDGGPVRARADELAKAIRELVVMGVRVINLSVSPALLSSRSEPELREALDDATRRHVIVVAAAGNEGAVASWTLTRHSWVISVSACDEQGHLLRESNLAASIGKRGLCAPGRGLSSPFEGERYTFGGTSAAAPLVAGTAALLASLFPSASAAELRAALTGGDAPRPRTIAPPLLNAWTAYQFLAARHRPKDTP